jgi:hypothetical protein
LISSEESGISSGFVVMVLFFSMVQDL